MDRVCKGVGILTVLVSTLWMTWMVVLLGQAAASGHDVRKLAIGSVVAEQLGVAAALVDKDEGFLPSTVFGAVLKGLIHGLYAFTAGAVIYASGTAVQFLRSRMGTVVGQADVSWHGRL